MKLLNPGYEFETIGGSLYYNSGSGNCYSGRNNATTTCDFTSTGIKNDNTRNMISESNYSLLEWNSISIYSDQIYEYERSTGSVYTGRPISWTGKIALAYPSDYGYAADLGKCTKILYEYNDSTCTSNNWMKNILATSNDGWLLNPSGASSSSAQYIYSIGVVGSGNIVYYAAKVTPVLFLNPELNILSGTGSSSDPYQLSV